MKGLRGADTTGYRNHGRRNWAHKKKSLGGAGRLEVG